MMSAWLASLPKRLIKNRGPNIPQLLSFFDDITAMTDQQAASLDAAFDTYDMIRWSRVWELTFGKVTPGMILA